MRVERHLDELASKVIREALDLDEDAAALLRPTNDPQFGDYQVNAAMGLAKKLKRPPRELAGPIAEALAAHDAIASAEVAGPGFVNLRLSDDWIAARLTEALRDDERDGVAKVEAPERIVVDFSSPNIAKQMHVGHLRSTILGDALVRLLRFVGHDVIGDNHLGDWGTQFGLLLVGMRRWGAAEALDADPIGELERVYKLASALAAEDEAFADAARAELAKLQAGDPDNRAQWQRFVNATRTSLDRVYDRLGVTFDEWLGESAYQDALDGVVTMLLERGLAREDQGAICVFFGELDQAPKSLRKQKEPFIVRKKDGAFLYSTTDIATVLDRRDRLGADRAVYVVDDRQRQHFQQLFGVMEMLGVSMRLDHVGFGKILGTDGKPLRTRDASGNTISLMSLLDEAVERVTRRMDEMGDRLRVGDDERAAVAEAIGVAAVKYADLKQNRLTDYQFDWDKMISFEGDAAPYLQYAHARTRSIFREGDVDAVAVAREGTIALGAPAEAALGRILLSFPDLVHKAAEGYQPHLICDHAYRLARAYSAFFRDCPVLRAEEPVRGHRLALNALAARQLHRSLTLLGIDPVERM